MTRLTTLIATIIGTLVAAVLAAPALAPASAAPDEATSAAATLGGRSYYVVRHVPDAGFYITAIYFQSNGLAYTKAAERPNKKTPICTKTGGACKKYTYNPKNKTVVIGGKSGRLGNGALTWNGEQYEYRSGAMKAGTRPGVLVEAGDWAGCDTITYCVYWGTDLTLGSGGKFRVDNYSINGSPSDSWTPIPEGKGRYRIVAGGGLTLTYASGATYGVPLTGTYKNDKLPRQGPFLIGREWFYHYDGDRAAAKRTALALAAAR